MVASRPTLLPNLGVGEAMSRSSIGPVVNTKSWAGSMLLATRQATSDGFCTSTKWSTTIIDLARLINPKPQSPCITLRAWPGYSFFIDTMTRLWNTPSAGILMSTISGNTACSSGRNIRSVTLPIQ